MKGLKAAQVHDSDTPSLSLRDWWGSGQYIKHKKTRGYRGYIRCAFSRLMGLRIGGYRITQMAKQKKTQYNNTKFIVLDSLG